MPLPLVVRTGGPNVNESRMAEQMTGATLNVGHHHSMMEA